MFEYEIVVSKEAKQDLTDIKHYLSQFYPSTHRRFREALDDYLQIIAFNPRCCPRYEYRPQYRKCNVKKYLMFYSIDEEAKRVEIHRIRHGSQDLQHWHDQ